MGIAGLPWYDLPELRAATDAWWKGIASAMRRAGIPNVPMALTRDEQIEALWERPDLLVTQICGYDLVANCRGKFIYVATPCFTAPGCKGPLYSSHIVVREDVAAHSIEDLRGLRCAINGNTSHSGCNAVRGTVCSFARGGRFFSSVVVSGSHARSLDLLRSGDADVAAIDCITYALLAQRRPQALDRIRIIAQTEPAPAPPYVAQAAAPSHLVDRLRSALIEAASDPALRVTRSELLLAGFEVLNVREYDRIRKIQAESKRCGLRDFDPIPFEPE